MFLNLLSILWCLQHCSAAAKLLQSCLTTKLPVPGILQARTLKWVAISCSNAWKWKVKVKSLSRVRLLATPWTAAYQAPPSMGFSRQEYWSGVTLCRAGRITNWNQDCWEKYQQPQTCRWYHFNGRKWRGTKEPLDDGERGEWKKSGWLKTQH